MDSRDRGLLNLDLLNSVERKDFEPDIVFHQPIDLELESSENAVSQSHREFKDQCNRAVLSSDITFKFYENFDGDVQGTVTKSTELKFGNPKFGSTYQKLRYRDRKSELTKSNLIVNRKQTNQPPTFRKSEWNIGKNHNSKYKHC